VRAKDHKTGDSEQAEDYRPDRIPEACRYRSDLDTAATAMEVLRRIAKPAGAWLPLISHDWTTPSPNGDDAATTWAVT